MSLALRPRLGEVRPTVEVVGEEAHRRVEEGGHLKGEEVGRWVEEEGVEEERV